MHKTCHMLQITLDSVLDRLSGKDEIKLGKAAFTHHLDYEHTAEFWLEVLGMGKMNLGGLKFWILECLQI